MVSTFDGFQLDHVNVGEVTLRVRHGGGGSPIVLLHGHPRTHTTWHGVAPRLAAHHFVVAPDLRGYGQSTLPPDRPDHAQSVGVCDQRMFQSIVRRWPGLQVTTRFAVARAPLTRDLGPVPGGLAPLWHPAQTAASCGDRGTR